MYRTVIVLIMLFCAGCGVLSNAAVRINPALALEDEEYRIWIDEQLQRTRALLSSERVGVTLWEVPPKPAPEVIDAWAGVGFYADGVFASVYIFSHQREHEAAFEKLRALTPQGVTVWQTSNGPNLFYGYTSGDDALLTTMSSAFAGDE